jgi:hypothetical protein
VRVSGSRIGTSAPEGGRNAHYAPIELKHSW